MRLTGGQVFDPEHGFQVRDLCVENGKIAADAQDAVRVEGCWLIPGLTDLHFHGCRGEDFSDGSPEGLAAMADYARSVAALCTSKVDEPPAAAPAAGGKWVCALCGYIYDPEQGDAKGGVAPGTPFESLPADWVCPLCRMGREMFKPAP